MNTAKALQQLAARLREIDTDSPADAERYIQRFTGDACRLIQPHWQTIVARAGIDWTGPEPFPADEYHDPGTDFDLWSMAWQSVAGVLWSSMRGHYCPGMSEFTTIRREPGLSVSTGTHNATDWRELAKDYAEILEAVAGWLCEEPVGAAGSTPVQQVEHLEQPKIKLPTNPDVAEVWNTVQAVEVGTANVSKICRSIAEKRGCNADSLRTSFNRWKRQYIG